MGKAKTQMTRRQPTNASKSTKAAVIEQPTREPSSAGSEAEDSGAEEQIPVRKGSSEAPVRSKPIGLGKGKGKLDAEQLQRMQAGRVGKGSVAKRLNMILPPHLIQKRLQRDKYVQSVPFKVAIYLTAAIECLLEDVIGGAIEQALLHKKGNISARHIMELIRQDEELCQLFGNVTIAHGGFNSFAPPPRPTVPKASTSKTKERVVEDDPMGEEESSEEEVDVEPTSSEPKGGDETMGAEKIPEQADLSGEEEEEEDEEAEGDGEDDSQEY